MPQSRNPKCNIFPCFEIFKMQYIFNFCKINIVERYKKRQFVKHDHIFYFKRYALIKKN